MLALFKTHRNEHCRVETNSIVALVQQGPEHVTVLLNGGNALMVKGTVDGITTQIERINELYTTKEQGK